jgi:O-antigen/teichoic acid export membrane protein
MVTQSKLVKGAVVLAAAAVISKLLGTLQKIPLQNIAGDAVFGIYNTVYPLYIVILILATAGVPIAVSKFVSEKVAQGDSAGALHVLYLALILLSGNGVLFFFILFYGADWIASLLGNRHIAASIQGISFALLVMPILAALRGYFQGLQEMMPTAVSQVAEQLIRVATMVLLLFYFIRLGAEDSVIAAGALFGSVTGAAAGAGVMVYYWRRHRRQSRLSFVAKQVNSTPAWPFVKKFSA